MLQLKQISKVLSQGLEPVELKSTDSGSSKIQPLSIALLNFNGVPLSTVSCTNLEEKNLSLDNIRIYSIILLNYFKSQREETDWSVLQLDEKLSIIIEKLNFKDIVNDEDNLYVIALYDKEVPDSIAKLKVDNICEVFNRDLKGFE